MSSSAITQIVLVNLGFTVAMELYCYWFHYRKPGYKEAKRKTLSRLAIYETEKKKFDLLDQSTMTTKALEKAKMKLKITQDQHASQAAMQAAGLARPKMIGMIISLIIFQRQRTKYAGVVVAILPFEAPAFIRRLFIQRGLHGIAEFGAAGNYLLVSLLVNFGLKAVLNKVFEQIRGKEGGAGVSAMMTAPGTRNMLKRLGGYKDEDLDEMEGVIKMFSPS